MSLWVCRNGHGEISYEGGDHRLQHSPVDCPICYMIADYKNREDQLLDMVRRRNETINTKDKKIKRLEKMKAKA